MRYLMLMVLGLVAFSESGSAGILARRARRLAGESSYYSYSSTITTYRSSPRIYYDRVGSPTDNFGRYNGEVVYENGEPWTWDSRSGVWRGPVRRSYEWPDGSWRSTPYNGPGYYYP